MFAYVTPCVDAEIVKTLSTGYVRDLDVLDTWFPPPWPTVRSAGPTNTRSGQVVPHSSC